MRIHVSSFFLLAFNLINQAFKVTFFILDTLLVCLIVLGPAMCARKSADFSDSLRTQFIKQDCLIPLGLVAHKVDSHGSLHHLLVALDINYAGREPFTHLVEHIDSIVDLKS